MWQKPIKDSQRRGSDLYLLSGVRISSSQISLRSVDTMRREGLKCQKNGAESQTDLLTDLSGDQSQRDEVT